MKSLLCNFTTKTSRPKVVWQHADSFIYSLRVKKFDSEFATKRQKSAWQVDSYSNKANKKLAGLQVIMFVASESVPGVPDCIR
jgi:hypothetical protein